MKIIRVVVILFLCQLSTTTLSAQHKDTLYVLIEHDSTTNNHIAFTNNAIYVDGFFHNGKPNDWLDSMGYSGMNIVLGKLVPVKTGGWPVRRNPLLTLANFRDSLKLYTPKGYIQKHPSETLSRKTPGSFLARKEFVLIASYKENETWKYRLITDVWYFYKAYNFIGPKRVFVL